MQSTMNLPREMIYELKLFDTKGKHIHEVSRKTTYLVQH
jgi:hypothetical protein